jgi:DNA (cytosine-5)-methyltransferase 1
MLTIGSLFSGIGGLELGLEWAGLGPVLWQVEQDDYCRCVLAKHWPDVDRSVTDARTAGASNLAPVDLICGGFPCQDVSSAGNRTGLTGSRSGLWGEFARIVAELEPRWVVVENVASGAILWLDAVVARLASLGYETLPLPLSAADCGAPHLRRRVFMVGRNACNGNGNGKPTLSEHAEASRVPGAAADSDGHAIRKQPGRSGGKGWACEAIAGHASQGGWWTTEPGVGRVADGVPDRVAQLRALGNAVVPQCAEVVGWVVRELEGVC